MAELPARNRLAFQGMNAISLTHPRAPSLSIAGLYLFLQVIAPLNVGIVKLRHYLLIGWGACGGKVQRERKTAIFVPEFTQLETFLALCVGVPMLIVLLWMILIFAKSPAGPSLATAAAGATAAAAANRTSAQETAMNGFLDPNGTAVKAVRGAKAQFGKGDNEGHLGPDEVECRLQMALFAESDDNSVLVRGSGGMAASSGALFSSSRSTTTTSASSVIRGSSGSSEPNAVNFNTNCPFFESSGARA